MASRPRRHLWPRLAAALLALAGVVMLGIAAFPWGLLRGTIERHLAAMTGKPVTIAAVERADRFSWTPTVSIRGVRVAGGDGGDLADIREVRVRFPALPLLFGRFRPSAVDIGGMRLRLARNAAGEDNWRSPRQRDRAPARPAIRHLTITDSLVDYRDAQRRRSFTARIAADGKGLRLDGTGEIHGAPVRVTARGAPAESVAPGRPWPFRVEIAGAAVGMTLAGRMDGPLDVGHFTAAVSGHGADLTLIDAIIGAGLPSTQPVRFRGQLRRDAPDWRLIGLRGTVGRSDVAGDLTITAQGGRHRIDGHVAAERFDFDDLASDADRRSAAARHAGDGPRLIPTTRIDLAKLGAIDGLVTVSARELLWPGSAPFRSLAATLKLDHSRLDVAPLRLGLSHGFVQGRARVDQRGGHPVLDLRVTIEGGRLMDLLPGTAIDAAMRARIGLSGPGRTIREAIGQSSGTVALFAHDGVIPARNASLLGQDVGRGMTTAADKLATLRCLVARLEVRDGVGRADPILIDTSRALTRATGSVTLNDERLALTLTGAPKKASLLRLSGGVAIVGTIKAPGFRLPEETRSPGGVLKMLARAIDGGNRPIAADLDCGTAAAGALR